VLEVGTAALIVVALAAGDRIWCGSSGADRVHGRRARMNSRHGLMLLEDPLMVPAFALSSHSAGAGKRRPSTVVLTVRLVVASSWFGAYSITAWGYAI